MTDNYNPTRMVWYAQGRWFASMKAAQDAGFHPQKVVIPVTREGLADWLHDHGVEIDDGSVRELINQLEENDGS